MEVELNDRRNKVSASHGSKRARENNSNIEYSIKIDIDSDNYKRWLSTYGSTLEELSIKVNNR